MTRTEFILLLVALALIAAGGILLAVGHAWAIAMLVVGLLLVAVLVPGAVPL